jgi:V/A-type H+-transporting ATPase subunit D
MADRHPTRAVLLEMQDERHAMREGHAFLDEKCLLLAGEMLRELAAHDRLERAFSTAHEAALAALQRALMRHGLDGLQVHPVAAPAGAPGDAALEVRRSALMGVPLQQARWRAEPPRDGAPPPEHAPLLPSPEAEACRDAFAALLAQAAPLAATAGNLERLSAEYRRSVRRARALQDVLLPELEHELRAVETALEELEQQDLVSMRRPAAAASAAASASTPAVETA